MNLTWIRPTANTIHLWNYFWAIKPLLDFAKANNQLDETYIFIADIHWLVWNDNFKLKENILNQYSIYKAMGFKNIFLQSDIIEINQIERYFSSFVNVWKLSRLHTIKEKLKDSKFWNIKLDLFTYPVLMAADIVWLWTKNVFLWKDQKQHLEVSKEIVKKINNKLKISLTIPNWMFFKDIEVVGTDWRKMSKSYNNYIDPFLDEKKLLKKINKISTWNVKMWEDKDFDNCNIAKLYKLFNLGENELAMRDKYKRWLIWYGESKKLLCNAIMEHFEHIKKIRNETIEKGWDEAKKEMLETWDKVRKIYWENLKKIKDSIFQ